MNNRHRKALTKQQKWTVQRMGLFVSRSEYEAPEDEFCPMRARDASFSFAAVLTAALFVLLLLLLLFVPSVATAYHPLVETRRYGCVWTAGEGEGVALPGDGHATACVAKPGYFPAAGRQGYTFCMATEKDKR